MNTINSGPTANERSVTEKQQKNPKSKTFPNMMVLGFVCYFWGWG